MADQQINGRFFRVGDVLATEAIILQARIMRFIGPAVEKLPAIFAGRGDKASDQQKAASDAAAISAITEVFSKCEPKDVAALIADICEMAMVAEDRKGNYDSVIFDQHFQAREKADIIPVVIFVLQETLGDFFSGAVGIGNRGKAAAASRNMKLDA